MGITRAEALYRKGNEVLESGNYRQAIRWYKKSLKLKPDQYHTLHNLATVYEKLGEHNKAETYYQKAMVDAPEKTKAVICYNIGNLYFHRSDFRTALDWYEQALAIDPYFLKALLNAGNTLIRMHEYAQAVKAFFMAMNVELTEQTVNSLGMALAFDKQTVKSKRVYQQGVQDFPESSVLWSNLFAVAKLLADWNTADTARSQIDRLVAAEIEAGSKPGETPFISLSWRTDAADHLASARLYSHHQYAKAPPVKQVTPRRVRSKLRIGYLSYDFRDHVMGYHSMPLFGLADTDRFETHAYSYAPADSSFYQNYIMEHATTFADIRHMHDVQAAQLIADDEIDILVDLAGYTTGNRFGISASRPAPIQVNYLGFPGSTGAAFMDYIIGDDVLIPETDQRHYSEAVVYVPHGYLMPSFELLTIPQPPTRSDCLLPEDGIVLAAFNRPDKFERMTWRLWMQLMQQLPNTVLWMSVSFSTTKEQLEQEAAAMGIPANRLVFTDNIRYEEHLSRLMLADIALDTTPYNGGSTTANALFAGVPVVTMKGSTYVSRMSMSMLETIGLGELVADTPRAYAMRVMAMVQNPHHLRNVRARLKTGVAQSKIFDARVKMRALESAYETMWECYATGQRPAHFTVTPSHTGSVISSHTSGV